MRIISEQTLKNYTEIEPDSRVAVQEWVKVTRKSNWANFADIKKTFNSVDSVGGQRYVFNIKGNRYRIIAIIRFSIKIIFIRFIGSHKEYDKIKDCSKI